MVDGMAMDRQGNLYAAMHNGNGKAPERGIVVLNPAGQIVERIPVPSEGLTTQLGFGRGAGRRISIRHHRVPDPAVSNQDGARRALLLAAS